MRTMRWLLILTVGVAVLAWAAWRFTRRAEVPAPPAGVDSVSTGVHSVELWFASADGDSLVREARDVVEPSALHERVADLVAQLERGPQHSGIRTLPPGTAVLHAYLDDRGLLTLDLSRAFQQGFRGGAGAEYLVLGSLVRTLAANLPQTKRVMLVCSGTPLASLGGHLPLDRPLEVSDWP